MTSLRSDCKAQTSLEYLYLTAFVIALATIVALLTQDIILIQEQTKNKLIFYRDKVINKLVQQVSS